MEPISYSLRDMLVRQGIRRRTVGAESLQGMKNRESAVERSIPEVAAEGRGVTARREFGGVGMITSNVRIIRERPLLAIIDCEQA